MRILITGGCGFIGVNLIAALQARGGCSICVLDNESLGTRKNLQEFSDVDFVQADIRDRAALDRAMHGVDCVVHLAADTRVMDSIANPWFNFDANVAGTLTVLEAMRAAGVRSLVNASTGGAILGEVPPPVHEGMLPQPTSPYGASKLAIEGYLSAYAASYGLAASSLRFSNVYGPRSYHKGSVVAQFMRQILAGEELVIYGDGSQQRDFIHVEDICAGILASLDRGVCGPFQLGSGAPTSLNELIVLLQDVTGRVPLPVRYEDFRAGEIRSTWSNIAKARAGLGFAPRIPLRQGLADTWHWFTSRAAA